MQKEHVLITGGAGYIGGTLAPMLLKNGYRVTVVDNLMYAQTPFMELCHHENFNFVKGDARDEKIVGPLVDEADILIPLACLTGAPACDNDQIGARTIVIDALEMLLARRNGQKILYPNTNSGYGIGQPGIFCTEESPLQPVSLYGKIKVQAEQMILTSGNCVCFRLATVFGASPRMRIDLLVNDFVYRAVTDGFVVLFEADAKRNYIHVRDVARGFLHGLNHWDQMQGNVYNLGLSDANLSKRELCEVIKRFVPRFFYAVADIGSDPDKRDYIVSNEKIEATGYHPEFSLERGTQELLKAFSIMKLRKIEFTNNPF